MILIVIDFLLRIIATLISLPMLITCAILMIVFWDDEYIVFATNLIEYIWKKPIIK